MLLSPYYPANYGNNDFCVWNITAGENYRILLEFENFDVSKTGGHKGLNICHFNLNWLNMYIRGYLLKPNFRTQPHTHMILVYILHQESVGKF